MLPIKLPLYAVYLFMIFLIFQVITIISIIRHKQWIWLLVIHVFPLIGLLLWWIAGRNTNNSKKARIPSNVCPSGYEMNEGKCKEKKH